MSVISAKTIKKRRFSVRRVLIITISVALFVAALVPFGLGFSTTWATTRPPCAGNPDAPQTPAEFNLPFTSINIPTRWGGVYRGFFVPGALDATIIIPPTGSGGVDGALRELAMLAGHGFNVLTYESRVCVGKPISLGFREVDDVGDVLDYLQRN